MAKTEYRGPSYEVAEYDHASRRITVSASFDNAMDALTSYTQMLLANEVPVDAVTVIRGNLHTMLLAGTTLFEHECLATNRRVSFIIRK